VGPLRRRRRRGPPRRRGRGTVRGDADAADHRDLCDGGEPSFAVGAGGSGATARPSRVRPGVLRRVPVTFSTKRRRLTRRGRTMRRSRRLVRRLGAPIRSLATSSRRWPPGKGGSSGTLDAHGRYLSAEERVHATEERDYAGAWSRRRDGRWGSSSAPSRGCDAWSRRKGPKVGVEAGKGRAIRTEDGPIRRRVALVRRRTAPSRCMVAPARRIDAAIGTQCPGDASAWSRWRDERWGPSVGGTPRPRLNS
jgi:hypothetical protein